MNNSEIDELEGIFDAEKDISEKPDPQGVKWEFAKKQFPKINFPWEILPGELSVSLKQVARSCATGNFALPGIAIAVCSSVIGSTINVSPKKGWREPLIFWFMDNRKSGAGKTPVGRKLMRLVQDAQVKADRAYEREKAEWDAKNKKERGPEPKRVRGYFLTDLTLEGIREDISGHGGTVGVFDELSAFISGQNQYKKSGSDRESWLCLHDGNMIRVVRAGKSKTVKDARINIFGGIQPQVFKSVFGGKDGLYLNDGTIYRFLLTTESDNFYALDDEAWTDENQKIWEDILSSAMQWADNIISKDDWKSLNLRFDKEAQKRFYDWRNNLFSNQKNLPGIINGYLPKIVSAAVRLTGIIHCMDCFSKGQTPREVLSCLDVEKGTKAAEFYLGQIVDAIQLVANDKYTADFEATEQQLHLSKILQELKPELDSGRLAVGFIQEKFNESCPDELRIKTPRAMGNLIRSSGLNVTPGKYNANGKQRAHCLQWDNKTNTFIEQCLSSLSSLQTHKPQAFEGGDIENAKSLKSRPDKDEATQGETSETLKNESLSSSTIDKQQFGDKRDIGDFVSGNNLISVSGDEVII